MILEPEQLMTAPTAIEIAKALDLADTLYEKFVIRRMAFQLERMKLREGSKVLYSNRGGRYLEEGVVTSRNEQFFFVRFTGDSTSKACLESDLRVII